MNIEEGLNSIKVFDGREFTYRFTPAAVMKKSPLLVILNARGVKVPSKFNHAEWNVLSVVDTFGLNGDMSVYLGEKGNFFIKDLLHTLIQEAIKKCDCIPNENLFFYASSVASPAAIIHGISFDARAVYLNAPIIRFYDTQLEKSEFLEAVKFVIPPHMKNIIEADMVKFMKVHSHKRLPTFFVCDSMYQTEFWLQNFYEEQTLYFVNACKQAGVPVHLESIETEGHKIHHTVEEIIETFENNTPPKYLDIIKINTYIENHTLKVNCILGDDYPKTGNELFAFYLLYKGKKVEASSYKEETEECFELSEEMDTEQVQIMCFVKSENGQIIQKKVNILL